MLISRRAQAADVHFSTFVLVLFWILRTALADVTVNFTTGEPQLAMFKCYLKQLSATDTDVVHGFCLGDSEVFLVIYLEMFYSS